MVQYLITKEEDVIDSSCGDTLINVEFTLKDLPKELLEKVEQMIEEEGIEDENEVLDEFLEFLRSSTFENLETSNVRYSPSYIQSSVSYWAVFVSFDFKAEFSLSEFNGYLNDDILIQGHVDRDDTAPNDNMIEYINERRAVVRETSQTLKRLREFIDKNKSQLSEDDLEELETLYNDVDESMSFDGGEIQYFEDKMTYGQSFEKYAGSNGSIYLSNKELNRELYFLAMSCEEDDEQLLWGT